MATYVILNFIVLIVLLIFSLPVVSQVPKKLSVTTLAILLVLTAVFDSLIIGSGIVAYDSERILGLKIGLAPIEDFFYSIAAVLVVIYFWEKKGMHEGKN
ncbi:lycopene cyclase domain-containing protein [Candidatus Saccharibacteria bacterium]|nr:lycopene cyclase domain-containing protein [Candidatus Saccharibacteria bacterium]